MHDGRGLQGVPMHVIDGTTMTGSPYVFKYSYGIRDGWLHSTGFKAYRMPPVKPLINLGHHI